MERNKKIASLFHEIADLLEIAGVSFKPAAYRRAAFAIENLQRDLRSIYKKEGIEGLRNIKGVGKSIAAKIEEYLTTKKIAYHKELIQKTAVRQIVTHFFETKGIDLAQLKKSARKREILYGRFAKAAKELLDLAGSVQAAKNAITKVAQWAQSRNLDYSLETVVKKWPELDRLKPKIVEKRPFFLGKAMVWSERKHKWYVIDDDGQWLEFAGEEKDIEWK